MKDLPLIDDSEIFGGRDKRLILKNQPDDQIDLILNQWAIDKGYSYHDAVGIALKDWLLDWLKDSPTHKWLIDRLRTESRSKAAEHCLDALTSLPLSRLGFPTPPFKNAMRMGVRRFLRQKGLVK